MTEDPKSPAPQSLELCTFTVGEALYGIDIRSVQEINRQLSFTPVPLAPVAVCGVVNLRGTVVTVLSLARLLGRTPNPETEETRNVIVQVGGEQVGLVVDRVADVVVAPAAHLEPPPSNLAGAEARVLRGVLVASGDLIGVLDVEAALEEGG